MPSLSHHHSSDFVKLLLLGDAKSGKTTSLASLVKAGYHLRILDFDNLLDVFALTVRANSPELLGNVEYRSIRDVYKGTAAGTVIDGKPRAWIDSLNMLNHWKYTDPETGEIIDYGKPSDWGPDTILVIDSLSRWCDAAYDFHEVMTPKTKGGDTNLMVIYGNAQDDVEKQLASLTSPSFRTNVIVICHGIYMQNPDGTSKIFPQGVGQKLSPKIPQYFPNYIRMTKKGEKRAMQMRSDSTIDLATTRPDIFQADLDPSTGLADFFAALKGPATAETSSTPARPKTLTLRKV